jgi:hypothetical protein
MGAAILLHSLWEHGCRRRGANTAAPGYILPPHVRLNCPRPSTESTRKICRQNRKLRASDAISLAADLDGAYGDD